MRVIASEPEIPWGEERERLARQHTDWIKKNLQDWGAPLAKAKSREAWRPKPTRLELRAASHAFNSLSYITAIPVDLFLVDPVSRSCHSHALEHPEDELSHLLGEYDAQATILALREYLNSSLYSTSTALG